MKAGRYSRVVIEAATDIVIYVENVNFRIRSIVLLHACTNDRSELTRNRILLNALSRLLMQCQLPEEKT